MTPPEDDRKAGKTYWLDQSRNVDKLFYVLVAACVAAAGADFFYDKHGHYEAETIFAIYGAYGFISCVLLVLAAKELRKLVMRDEDYYQQDDSGHGDAGDDRA